MSWEFAPPLDAAHRAALEAGKNLVYVCPPAAWAALPVFAGLAAPAREGLHTAVLVPGSSAAAALGDGLAGLASRRPVHVASGLARTERLLRAGAVGTLISAPVDALELVRRSAIKLEDLPYLVIGWPEELLRLQQGSSLDTLLSEAARAQRIILTASEPAIVDFLERHARRAPLVPAAPLPAEPAGPALYAVVEPSQLRAAAVRAVDTLNPETAVIWGPGPRAPDAAALVERLPGLRSFEPAQRDVDLAIALDLPSADLLAQLRATARDVLLLIAAWQTPYLSRLAAPLKALKLTAAVDQARDHVFAVRQRVAERLQAGDLAAELMMLEPLFDEHDPALVAAAALSLGRAATPASGGDLPTWVRIRVNAGRREQIRVGDLVGALLNGVRLTRDDVGKIDLHESFALVDVRAAVAEQAVRELNGMTVRGRRLTATIDRR